MGDGGLPGEAPPGDVRGARAERARGRARALVAESHQLLAESEALLLEVSLALAVRGVRPKEYSARTRRRLRRALLTPRDTP